MAKKGLFSKLIEGTEKTDGEARAALPTNRFGLFWDIFKNNFVKLFLINLLILLFFVPVIILLFYRTSFIMLGAAEQPFSQNLITGYPIVPGLQGVDVRVTNGANLFFFGFLPLAMIIASVGLSGGLYVIRNMVWTEGTFISSDFWRGIKKNFFVVVFTVILYCAFLFLTSFSLGNVNYLIAIGWKHAWLLYVAKVATYLLLAVITLMMMYMLTMGVTYNLKFTKMIRNAFLLTFGLLPTNLIFALLTVIPLILIFVPVSLLNTFGFILFALCGITYMLLCWTNYSQWVFDKTMNSRISGAKVNRGIYEKVENSDSETLKQYKMQLREMVHDPLLNTPRKPIDDEEIVIDELPANFSRADLQKLAEQKRKMQEDAEKWAEEHINDERYVELRKMKEEAEREKAEAEEKRKKYASGKGKKEKKPKDKEAAKEENGEGSDKQ